MTSSRRLKIMALQWASVPTLESGVCPPEGVWHEVPTGDIGLRVGSSADFLPDGNVLLIGGADAEGPLSKVHLLDIKNVKWTNKSCTNFPARYEHGTLLCQSEGLLYVFGGAEVEGPLGDMWKYDIEQDKWSGVPMAGCSVSPRTIHSPATYKSSLVVFGGGKAGDHPADAVGPYVFSSDSGEWYQPEVSGSSPCPRQGHVSACVGDRLFVHGGMANMTFFDDLYSLDIGTWKWKQLQVNGEIPSPRAAHGCAVHGSQIIIFGGVSMEGSLNDLFSLNTDTLQWARIETQCAPSPRLDVAMCPIRISGNISEDHKDQSVNAIFVFGGVDTGGNAYDDCYILKL